MPVGRTTGTRLKAVELAVGQIEKQFGKGSIMRLGQKDAIAPIASHLRPARSASTTRSASAACRAAASSRSSGRSRRARRRWRCRSSPRRRSSAAWRRSSTPSTRSTRRTRRSSASTSTTCSSRSPTTASRRSKSSKCSSAPNGVDVVVVDSVAALVPRAEIEGEMGEAQMGLQARLMSQALRKLTGAVSKSKTCLIFINQLREKIGVMFGNPGNDHRRPRAEVLRVGPHRHPPHRRASRTATTSSAAAPASRSSRTRWRRRSARPSSTSCTARASRSEGDLLDLAVERKIVEKSGAWFAYGGERLGQGRENVKQFLKDNPAICKAIEERVRRELGLRPRAGSRDGLGHAEVRSQHFGLRTSLRRSRPSAKRPSAEGGLSV